MATRGQGLKTNKSKQKKTGEMSQSDLESSQMESEKTGSKMDDISDDIKEIKCEMKEMLKKTDIEELIKNTITETIKSLEDRLKDQLKKEIEDKCEKLENVIQSLEHENEKLKEKLEMSTKKIEERTKEIEVKIVEQEQRNKDAIKMGNHNEQYSRKNNIRIMDIEEEPAENEEKLTEKVCSILSKQGVVLSEQEILAIHRLPSRIRARKPVIVKTINNSVKTRIMRRRKEMKAAGYRIADDVTRLNTGLISRIQG